MPPKTRKAKKEEIVEDEEEQVEDVKPGKLPDSNMTYDRKIVVAKNETMPNSKIVKLRHPKEGCAMFRISEKSFDEILAVNEGHRSFFYGESVIGDGTVHLFCPYNSVFICLPYLQKTASKFVQIDEILIDNEYDATKELAQNEKVMKSLEAVCDIKDLLDVKLFRLNEQKLMDWISRKFEGLKKELEVDAHQSLLQCKEAFDRHVFTFLSDYLPSDIAASVKNHLNIQDAVVTENIDMSMKRKSIEEDFDFEKPAAKKPKESIQTKKLQAASKGTKSISSFFTKKN